jgi:hypothetical protein
MGGHKVTDVWIAFGVGAAVGLVCGAAVCLWVVALASVAGRRVPEPESAELAAERLLVEEAEARLQTLIEERRKSA